HSLHLAPGELVRPVASAVQQTHLRQGRLDAWADVPRAAVVEQERESDVLLGRVCGQEVEELEDDPDLPAPEHRDLVVSHPREHSAVDSDLPRARLIESADQVEERGALDHSGRTWT